MDTFGSRYPRGPEYPSVTADELFEQFTARFSDPATPTAKAARLHGKSIHVWRVTSGIAQGTRDADLHGALVIIGERVARGQSVFRAQVAQRELVPARFEYGSDKGRYVLPDNTLGGEVFDGHYAVMADVLEHTVFSSAMAEVAAQLVKQRLAL